MGYLRMWLKATRVHQRVRVDNIIQQARIEVLENERFAPFPLDVNAASDKTP